MTVQTYHAAMPTNARGRLSSPRPVDLSSLTKLARSIGGSNRFKKAYAADQSSSCTLLLTQAAAVAEEMNAYDDTTVFAVPYVGEVNDSSDRRIQKFCQSLLTANGCAGVGSTWDGFIDTDHQVVVLRQRSSIPD